MHNVPPEEDFESSRSPRKIGVLKQSQSALFSSIKHIAILFCIHMCDECMKSIDFRLLSQALVHFVIDRASLFTDHRISGRPNSCQVSTCQNHLRVYMWQFSKQNFISSSLKWWSSMHGVDTLQSCCVDLLADSQYRSTHFFAWPSIFIRPWRDTKIFRRFSEYGSVFCSLRKNSRFKHGSVNCPQYLCLFHIVFECIPSIHDQGKDVVSPRSTSLLSTFHIGLMFLFLSSQFLCHPHTQIRINPL